MENNTINFNDSNIHKFYKTKDVAEILNVNTQTIRNYCLMFEQFLDAGKNHKLGKHRTFTKQDVKKLKSSNSLFLWKFLKYKNT